MKLKTNKAEHVLAVHKKMVEMILTNMMHKKLLVQFFNDGQYGGALGFTQKGAKVYLCQNHHLFAKKGDMIVAMCRLGLGIHEGLHQLLSPMSKLTNLCQTYASAHGISTRPIHAIINICEDGFIEHQASKFIAGPALEALDKMDDVLEESAHSVHEAVGAYGQFIAALNQYEMFGRVHGGFTDSTAAKAFMESVPIYEKMIDACTDKKRMELMEQICDIAVPLIKADEQAAEQAAEDVNGDRDHSSNEANGSGAKAKGKDQGDESRKEKRRQKTSSALSSASQSADNEPSSEDSDTSEGQSSNTSDSKDNNRQNSSKSSRSGQSNDSTDACEENDACTANPDDSNDADEDVKNADSKGEESDAESESSSSSPENPGADDSMADTEKDAAESGNSSDLDNEDEGNSDTSDSTGDSKQDESATDGENVQDAASADDSADSSDSADSTSDNETDNAADAKDSGKDTDDSKDNLMDQINQALNTMDSEIIPEDGDDDNSNVSDSTKDWIDNQMSQAEKQVAFDEKQKEKSTFDPSIEGQIYPNQHPYLNNVEPMDGDSELYRHTVQNGRMAIAGFEHRLRGVIDADQASKAYQQHGKLDIKRLCGSRVTPDIFTKMTEPKDIGNMDVLILVDNSGSMNGIIGRGTKSAYRKIDKAKELTTWLTEGFERVGIKAAVMGFESDDHLHTHHLYRGFGGTKADKYSIMQMRAGDGNFDALAVDYATQVLKKQPSKYKVMLVISDGDPSCGPGNRIQRNADLTKAIDLAKKAGIIVCGVAMANPHDSEVPHIHEHYKGTFALIDQADTAMKKISHLVYREIRRKAKF